VRQKGKAVVFSPDGRTAAFAGPEWEVSLWDLESGRVTGPLPLPAGYARYAFLPDGRSLLTDSDKALPRLWEVATGKLRRRFEGYPGRSVRIYAVSPDGKRAATAGGLPNYDTEVRLWDVTAGREWAPFGGHADAVTCVALSADGRTLVSGSKDRTVRIWDVATSKELRVYRGHGAAVSAVALAPDSKAVLSGDEASVVHLWDPATGKQLRCFPLVPRPGSHANRVSFVAFRTNGKTLVAGNAALYLSGFKASVEGALTQWDRATGRVTRTKADKAGRPVALSPDGRTTAWASLVEGNILAMREGVQLRDVASGRILVRLKSEGGEQVDGVIFAADSKTFATATRISITGFYGGGRNEPHYRLWESATGKGIAELKHGGPVMAFSPDGKLLAAAGAHSRKHEIRLLNPASGREEGQLRGHRGRVTCCVFSADGKVLASGSEDQSILVWTRP
jgi:WD40 repeat protein